MQSQADSTTVSYSNLPTYLQPYSGNQNHPGYNPVGFAPVGYSTATVCVRPSHLYREEPHLGDCITPSPSHSNSSHEESCKETLFRPIDFDRFSAGARRTSGSVPPTPSDSSGRSSPIEEDPADVLLVRIPRKPPLTQDTKPETNGVKGANSNQDSIPTRHGITVNLLDKELWKMFKSVGNEMIVTKPGR